MNAGDRLFLFFGLNCQAEDSVSGTAESEEILPTTLGGEILERGCRKPEEILPIALVEENCTDLCQKPGKTLLNCAFEEEHRNNFSLKPEEILPHRTLRKEITVFFAENRKKYFRFSSEKQMI